VAADHGSSAWVDDDPTRGENVFDSWERGSAKNIRVFDLAICSSILSDAEGSGFVRAIANVQADARFVAAAA